MAAPTPTEEETQSPYSVAEPEPGKSNPFACNVCKRNYSRVDHLARYAAAKDSCVALYVDCSRHYRSRPFHNLRLFTISLTILMTDTREKPFICQTCSKAFARA